VAPGKGVVITAPSGPKPSLVGAVRALETIDVILPPPNRFSKDKNVGMRYVKGTVITEAEEIAKVKEVAGDKVEAVS